MIASGVHTRLSLEIDQTPLDPLCQEEPRRKQMIRKQCDGLHSSSNASKEVVMMHIVGI